MGTSKGITRRQLIKGAAAGVIAAGWSQNIYSAPAKQEIPIAVCTSLSGSSAYLGQSTVQGAQLAVDQKNAKGGMAGRMFKLVVGDDAANPKEAIPFLRRALMRDKAVAVTGNIISDVALATRGLLEERKIPNIPVMGAVNELVTEGTRYTFRITGSAYQWQVAVPQFFKFKELKKVAMLHEDTSYGRDCAKDFVIEAKKQGLEIVRVKMTPFGDTNFVPVLNDIKEFAPEGIYVILTGAINIFATKQMAEVGLNPKVKLGAYTTSLPFYAEALKDFVIGYYGWSRPTKGAKIQEVEKEYQKKYKRGLDIFSCYGYDALNVITDAVLRANSDDPEAIRDEISKTRYDGICGHSVEFTKNGGALKHQLYIGQWEKTGSGYEINEVWHSDVIPPLV